MIPQACINEWREFSPWPTEAQIEQDLILSRAIIEIFSEPLLAESLAFRGGTALHKLFIQPPGRYSEDIDLVQINEGNSFSFRYLHGVSTTFDLISDQFRDEKYQQFVFEWCEVNDIGLELSSLSEKERQAYERYQDSLR